MRFVDNYCYQSGLIFDMKTIASQLEVKDKCELNSLMFKWSSCMRYALQRMINNESPKKHNDFHKLLKTKFELNYRYIDHAIEDAQKIIAQNKALETNQKRVIFGSRKVFRQLQKRHLSVQQRQKLKEQYREQRQCNLYSRGDKSHKGNVNTKIIGNELRINIGYHKYIYCKIHQKSKRFEQVLAAPCYSVRIIRRNNVYYAHFTIEEPETEVKIIKENGTIGIDLNAFPSNIAWSEASKEGNYLESGTIKTPYLYDCRGTKRDYYVWQHAHEITNIALKKNKAIVIENLRNLKGLNRALSNWCRAKLKHAIITCAKRKGIELIQVNPAHTSIIGCVKYAPLYNLSRHTSAALVIARRGIGHKEELPKIFIRLINIINVPQEKKEVDYSSLNARFKHVYEVCRKAVLTEQFTGKVKCLPNWSFLKRFLFNQDYSKFKKLAPLLGRGASACHSQFVSKGIKQ